MIHFSPSLMRAACRCLGISWTAERYVEAGRVALAAGDMESDQFPTGAGLGVQFEIEFVDLVLHEAPVLEIVTVGIIPLFCS